MSVDCTLQIPEQVLLPHVLLVRAKEKTDPDKWSDYDIKTIIGGCGHEYSHIPLENVRVQAIRLRKAGKLGRLGKRGGQTAFSKPPDDYIEYLKGDWWKSFRIKVFEFWKYKCSQCCSTHKLDVHHREYVNLGREELSDCLCLCRRCHRSADVARKRQLEGENCSKKNLF